MVEENHQHGGGEERSKQFSTGSVCRSRRGSCETGGKKVHKGKSIQEEEKAVSESEQSPVATALRLGAVELATISVFEGSSRPVVVIISRESR
ncbi:MAG: hypothetical protein NNA23_12090 [Nitrospira sp.]|nr:hypothetical protein [Nitrospira sp.]